MAKLMRTENIQILFLLNLGTNNTWEKVEILIRRNISYFSCTFHYKNKYYKAVALGVWLRKNRFLN